MTKKEQDIESALALAEKLDVKINAKLGYNANTLANLVEQLMTYGRIEVGWRESCRSTHITLTAAREWKKVLKCLLKCGIQIESEEVKHGNGWASKAGGFWKSIRYSMRVEGPTP